VVIAEATRRLLGNLFELKDLGARDLKGVAEPVRAWVALRASTVESRFEALHPSGLTALIGREEETELLLRRWSRVKSGEGQVVLISGEAGIGKSRLTAALLERVAPEPHTRLRYFCSPQHTDSEFHPIIGQMERAAGLLYDDMPQQKLDKLDALLAQTSTSITDAALIAEMLSLPNDGRYPTPELTPQRRRQKTLEALTAQMETLSRQQPVLMIFEDAQWADPTSLEAFGRAVDRIRTLKVLLLVTFRPEFDAPWVGRPYVTARIINRLAEQEAGAMIDRIVGNKQLSASIRQDIIERTDGIPLFVEEMTKAVLEAGSEAAAARAIAAIPSPALAVPASLYASLMARLDRLGGPVKELAQIAAAIGREFSHALLASVVRQPETELNSALDRLIAAGLLFRQGMPPHATYVFKHALVQDAAYGTLLREPRRRLHARIAETIESELTESAESRPELLTYHWRQGGDSIKAVHYLLMAAERGLYRSATTEALSHLAQARELISDLPKTKDQLQLQLKLEITLARAMLATHGYTASETRKAYRSARGCCEALGDQASLPLIIYGQWLSAWVAADHQSALELAQQLCVWGECNNDSVGLAVGHCALGMTLTTLGRLLDARSHLDQALRINKFVLPGRQPFVASDVDGRISTLSFMHNCLLLLGLPDQAEAAANEVATLKPDNLYSQALAQLRLLRMHAFARDVLATAERGLKLLRLAQEQGYPFMIATANIYVGWALTQRGEIAGGIESCQNGLAQLQATGANCWLPFHLTLLAECHERAGENAPAAKAVGEALEAVKTTGEHIWEAEIYRLKGRLLLRGHGDANGAEECFVKAVGIARRQHAKLLELRAAVSLADLLHREPRSADARQVLAPVYDSFTEGFEFIDLREAKACLDSLSD